MAKKAQKGKPAKKSAKPVKKTLVKKAAAKKPAPKKKVVKPAKKVAAIASRSFPRKISPLVKSNLKNNLMLNSM